MCPPNLIVIDKHLLISEAPINMVMNEKISETKSSCVASKVKVTFNYKFDTF